ncbi:hypothetical protein NDN08_001785 [Rhodosorus marinus]|uniref:Uncharacterized protein n=1 Tax=Rhodosorus marinus TaxID=101924 RepID=A0AAV8UUM4_9RHOD|nr:hypothetical protein NDN08_001785 [Rhodosorus marinus]
MAEELRAVLREFYSSVLDDQRRSELNRHISELLNSSHGISLALSVVSNDSDDGDPQLGFFCAVLIEDVARKRYRLLPGAVRDQIGRIALSVLVSQKYPSFVNVKFCNIIVQCGKAELAINPESGMNFLESTLSMANSGDDKYQRIGTEILAIAVDDSVNPLSCDLLSRHRTLYQQLLNSRISEISDRLTFGLFHNDVRVAALCAEGIAGFLKSHRHNQKFVGSLQVASVRRYGDDASCTCLTALMESYSTRSLTTGDAATALTHLTELLNSVSGESTKSKLLTLSLTEILLEKLIIRLATDPALEARLGQCLFELLRITRSAQSADIFIAGQRCWIVVADRLAETVESGTEQVVTAATTAAQHLKSQLMELANECLQKALFVSNGNVLETLEYWSDDEDETVDSPKNFNYAATVQGDGEGGRIASERSDYISKCLEVLSELIRLYPEEIRPAALNFSLSALKNSSIDVRDRKVALQLLGDSAQEGSRPLTEQVAVYCLREAPALRAAAYRTISSMISALENDSDMAKSVAEFALKDCRSNVLSERPASVAAAEFLSQLTTRIRPLLFQSPPLDAGSVAQIDSDRAVALLNNCAMQVYLIPNRGKSVTTNQISDSEWEQRGLAFKNFLLCSLPEYSALSFQPGVLPDSDRLTIIVSRGVQSLQLVFENAEKEYGKTRDAVWSGCDEIVKASCELVGRLLLGTNGLAIGMILRMLSRGLSFGRKFVGDLPRHMIEKVFRMISEASPGENFDPVLAAFFELLQSELSEMAQTSAESMVIPTVELCVKYIIEGENPEIRVLALVTLREALSRQWNIFFPADTSEAYVTNDPNQVIPDSPLFRRAIEGILFALTNNEPGVVEAALTDIEMMDSNRRLFSRPAFKWTEIGPSTIKSLFGVLMARIHTAYADRIRFLLYRISENSDGMFMDHFLTELLKSQMHLADEERKELQEQFGRPTDAQSFNNAADALTNDISYFAAIRRQAELP